MLKKTDSGNPKDWLGFARMDLDAVRVLINAEVSFTVCKSKLAEALEKCLKADLLSRGWRLEKIHDLQKLNDHLSVHDENVSDMMQSLVDELAESYTTDRYPGFDLEDPNWPAISSSYDGVLRYLELLQARLQ